MAPYATLPYARASKAHRPTKLNLLNLLNLLRALTFADSVGSSSWDEPGERGVPRAARGDEAGERDEDLHVDVI